MKTWYSILCEIHKEAIEFFVSNPSCTAHYLSKYDAEIQKWLEIHGHCGCKLIADDIQLDELFNDGYKIDFTSKIGKIYKPITN